MYRSTKKKTKKQTISAFTLLELLAVITTVIILTGITFGVSKGVLNQQARVRAKAELSLLAQALEEFKLTYGDYPIISEDGDPTSGFANAKGLTYALTGYGKQGREGGAYQFIEVSTGDAKSFIDVTRFNYGGNAGFVAPGVDGVTGDLTSDSPLFDPWNQAYVYVYNRNNPSWDKLGYVLFSKGSDRSADLGNFHNTGIVSEEGNNSDNIYPNK